MKLQNPLVCINLIGLLKGRELVAWPANVVENRSVTIDTTMAARTRPTAFIKAVIEEIDDLPVGSIEILQAALTRYAKGKIILKLEFAATHAAKDFARDVNPILAEFVGADGKKYAINTAGEPNFRVSDKLLYMVCRDAVYRYERMGRRLPSHKGDWEAFSATWTPEMIQKAAQKIRFTNLPAILEAPGKKYRIDVFQRPGGTVLVGATVDDPTGEGATQIDRLSNDFDSVQSAREAALTGFEPWRGISDGMIVALLDAGIAVMVA